MTDNALHIEEKARPMGDDAVISRSHNRGTQCPNERAGIKMTDATPRPQAGVGGKAGICEAGLAPGTQVLTLDGAIPVEFLNPGDRVITRCGVRTLKAVMRHNLPEGTSLVRVSADALGGLGTPDKQGAA